MKTEIKFEGKKCRRVRKVTTLDILMTVELAALLVVILLILWSAL